MLFRRRASEIVELAEKAERELSQRELLIDGEISIGTGELEAVKLIPKLFMSFKEKYPGVYLDLFTADADHIKQRVDQGLTDIGILLEPVEIEKYDFIRLNIEENWIVLMKSNDPLAQKDSISLDDLSRLPLIIPNRIRIINEIESWFRNGLKNLNIVAHCNLSTNASILVEQGVGYALTIEGSLPFLDETKLCCKPLKPEKKASSVLVWKKHQPLSPTISKFIEHIQNQLQQGEIL